MLHLGINDSLYAICSPKIPEFSDGSVSFCNQVKAQINVLKANKHCFYTWFVQEKEAGEGRGRFKSHSTAPSRISDREKKAPLKT